MTGDVVPKFQVSPGAVGVMHIKNEDGGSTPTVIPKRKRDAD
jgi:hypothetical protein